MSQLDVVMTLCVLGTAVLQLVADRGFGKSKDPGGRNRSGACGEVSSSGGCAWGDDSVFVGLDDGLGAVAEPELLKDACDMGLRRCLADYERVADLGVRESAGEQSEHFSFARG